MNGVSRSIGSVRSRANSDRAAATRVPVEVEHS